MLLPFIMKGFFVLRAAKNSSLVYLSSVKRQLE
jgi:hypothetical protein